MDLIVVSSLDALCRQEACENLAAAHPGSTVVFHDLLENGVVIRRIFTGAGEVERAETVLEHGCLSCAVRLDLVPSVERLITAGQDGPIIIGLPPAVPSAAAISALRRGLGGAAPVFSAILACAPDALEDQIWDSHTLFESGFTPLPDDERTPGEFLMGELAFADRVLLAEPDIVPADPAGRERGLHLLDALAPHSAPAPDTASPFTTVFQRVDRPLHPGRFRQALGTLAEGCCVMHGHLWMASAPECRIAIQGIGPRVWLENVGHWPEGHPGPESAGGRQGLARATVISATGEGLDQAEFERLLRNCELTDQELASAGHLDDPFGLEPAT